MSGVQAPVMLMIGHVCFLPSLYCHYVRSAIYAGGHCLHGMHAGGQSGCRFRWRRWAVTFVHSHIPHMQRLTSSGPFGRRATAVSVVLGQKHTLKVAVVKV